MAELFHLWLGPIGGLFAVSSALFARSVAQRCQRLSEAYDPATHKLELRKTEANLHDIVETYRADLKTAVAHAEATYDAAVVERERAKRDYNKARSAEHRANASNGAAADEPEDEYAVDPALMVK